MSKKNHAIKSSLSFTRESCSSEKTQQAMLDLLKNLERDKARAEHEKAQDEAILASIGEALVVVDMTGKIVLVNKTFERLLGWKQKDVLGKRCVDVMHCVDQFGNSISDEMRPVSQVLRGIPESKIKLYEGTVFHFIARNKRRFPVFLKASPIMMGGKLVGAVQVFRDITKEREIDQAKNEFVSLAGHQLRTPISIINWFVELLNKKGGLDKKQKEYLDAIYEASKRMGRLVNQLLNVSRMDMGTIMIEPIQTDLIELMRDTVKQMQSVEYVAMKPCEISFVASKISLAQIPIDPLLFRQIFINLITNAISYTPATKKCRVVVTMLPPTKKAIVISVADQGIGIPEAVKTKIFQRMFRADNAIKLVPDGTGLGLYLAKKIVDLFGGRIWFESEENIGTTFFVEIPLSGMKKREGTKQIV